MLPSTVKKAVDFFYSFFEQEVLVGFYGGEPLLAFPLIEDIVQLLQGKNECRKKAIRHTITTNGSLFTPDIIEFMDHHSFKILLSFDGTAQEAERDQGSFRQIVSTIGEILRHPSIDFEVNSVFSPKTIDLLTPSIQFILDLGVPKATFALDAVTPWDHEAVQRLKIQLAGVRELALDRYGRDGAIPVGNFHSDSRRGIFHCTAGMDRLVVTPDETLWGCFLFPDYMKGKEDSDEYRKYCFGRLDNFMENHETIYPTILSNHTTLRADNFCTDHMDCFLCHEIIDCRICPVSAALASSVLKKIPSWLCEIKRLERREKERFRKEIGDRSAK